MHRLRLRNNWWIHILLLISNLKFARQLKVVFFVVQLNFFSSFAFFVSENTKFENVFSGCCWCKKFDFPGVRFVGIYNFVCPCYFSTNLTIAITINCPEVSSFGPRFSDILCFKFNSETLTHRLLILELWLLY